MERNEAIGRLQPLIGKDLVPLAADYGVTIWKDGKKNKGWAGHVVERHLGLPINSSRAPNFGSWELKVVPLKYLTSGKLTVKETMAITMIDPVEVKHKEFEDSHLFTKLRKMLVIARVFESQEDVHSVLHAISEFDLDNPDIRRQVKADYDLVRKVICVEGFSELSGKMGVLVQPRTKGPGHGSTSRAFYARAPFVKKMLGIV